MGPDIARALCAYIGLIGWAGIALAEPTPIGIVLAAGDISTCNENKVATKVAQQIRKRIEAASYKDENGTTHKLPVKVLALGDLAYGKGKKDEFGCFLKAWSGFESHLTPVMGNHDYATERGKYFYETFKDNPAIKQNEGTGFFQILFPNGNGPWQLIGLNSNFYDFNDEYAKAMRDRQRKWLVSALQPAPDGSLPTCVMAFWHEPTFSSGKHGHGYEEKKSQPLDAKRPLHDIWRILYDHGATVVLAGHDHNYEQLQPQDSSGKIDPERGLRSFVVGTGGALLTYDEYTELWPASEGVFGKSKGKRGILEITLYDDHYEWRFIDADGNQMEYPKTTTAECVARRKP